MSPPLIITAKEIDLLIDKLKASLARDRVVAGRTKTVVTRWHEQPRIERPNCPLYNDQKLKLGLFGTNCSNGLTVSHADDDLPRDLGAQPRDRAARRRDGLRDAGADRALARLWRHHRLQRHLLRDLHLGGGAGAATERIMVFSTSHVPTVHPIVAAKQSVTVDHISNGRFGLNLVMGWFTPEMEMFGAPQREHDERYALRRRVDRHRQAAVDRRRAVRFRRQIFPHPRRPGASQAAPEAISGADQRRQLAGRNRVFSARGRFQFPVDRQIRAQQRTDRRIASDARTATGAKSASDLCDDDLPRHRARGAGSPSRDPGEGRSGAPRPTS